MLEAIVNWMIVGSFGVMLGEWLWGKTNEFRARRKIWEQFTEFGLPEEQVKAIVRSITANFNK